VFAAIRGGSIGVFRRRFDAGARAESILVRPQALSMHAITRDGRELFFRSGGGADPWLVSATFEPGPFLRVRWRTPLFNVASYEFATPHRNYDVFPDGRSFVMVRQGRPGQLAEVVYVQDPQALLGRR
jgi:hypothetical protein